jgi:acetyltransferase-like isoleucine patch superfamily enzyme/acyl carrier protein
MMSPFAWVRSPEILLEAITKHRGTHLWLPNFALGHLTKSIPDQKVSQHDLSSVEKLVLCSEPVLPETVRSFLAKFGRAGLKDSALVNCYAMAENTFAMTSQSEGPLRFLPFEGEKGKSREIACAGRPLPNVRMRIIDPAGSTPESLGEMRVGEIAIQSDCMLSGYHGNPDATASSFTQGWFRTGDLGFLKGGELYVTGRKKDVIIVGGENIFPQDIEEILNHTAGLVPGRNVVFGVEDGRGGTQRIVALAEQEKAQSTVDANAIRARILNELGISLSELHLLPHMTLKKGTAGKVSRSLNREAFLAGDFSKTVSTHRPDSMVSEIVRELVLDRHQAITPETPLLSSGLLDSFAFTSLVSQLQESFGIEIRESDRSTEHFDTISSITRTMERLGEGKLPKAEDFASRRAESLKRLETGDSSAASPGPWVETLINRNPIQASWVYRALFRMAGIHVASGVRFLGRVRVKLRGNPANIRLGKNVVIGRNVDLRIRENGKIILHDRAYLDDEVRVVAAREGRVEIGMGSEIGRFTVINSGGVTTIGKFAMIAGNVNINSSRHGTALDAYIKEQPHTHGVIQIGDDVWIGSGVSIVLNSKIGSGGVVSSNSLVAGELPDFSISAGIPAKVVRFR